MNYRMVKLGSVCCQDRHTISPGELKGLRYIGLESIEAGTGTLALGELSKTPEEPQANSFRFGTEHVLYGKLRPYLNKVLVPEFEGKCSTEIVPLLPSDELDRRYLAYFLRSSDTFSKITEKSSGARMPRADMNFILGLEIPLPALAEQRRIVDLLSRAEGIVRLRREAQVKAQAIIPALFLDMFGDPATNPKGWPMRAIEELCSVQTGATPRKENRRYYDAGTIPWVKTGEVCEAYILDAEEFITELAVKETNCKVFPPHTILVAMYGQGQTRGRTGILKIPATTNQACAAILPGDRIDPFYLYSLLKMEYERLRAMGRGGNQANLNLGMVKSFMVPCPPTDAQVQFVGRVLKFESVFAQQATALQKAKAIFQALLVRAFSADLAPVSTSEEAIVA